MLTINSSLPAFSIVSVKSESVEHADLPAWVVVLPAKEAASRHAAKFGAAEVRVRSLQVCFEQFSSFRVCVLVLIGTNSNEIRVGPREL